MHLQATRNWVHDRLRPHALTEQERRRRARSAIAGVGLGLGMLALAVWYDSKQRGSDGGAGAARPKDPSTSAAVGGADMSRGKM
jgi:ferric-dicitrate binding protein FerR (iron transport regulator)